MTLTTTIYNTAGKPFKINLFYEIEGNQVTIYSPDIIEIGFGNGWIDDIVEALHTIIDFDFELKII